MLKKFYVVLFLVIFAGYYACITFFYHTHIVLGETIGHSHPYKAGADGKPVHSHSERGYLTIYLLSSITLSLVASTFFLKKIILLLYEFPVSLTRGIATDITYRLALLRAPPR